MGSVPPPGGYTIEREDLDGLFEALHRRGYTIVGPTVRDEAIVYDEIASCAELPIGWTDEQEAGQYRLRRRDDLALFGYNVGPHSWKRFQLPPEVTLWRARRDDRGALHELAEPSREPPRYAFIGARSCELHAMGILDRVLLGGAVADPADRARRQDVFVVAVQCSQAGRTCFCSSMGTGPTAESGYRRRAHRGARGRAALLRARRRQRARRRSCSASWPMRAAAARASARSAQAAHARAAAQMGRELDTSDIRELLYRNYEQPALGRGRRALPGVRQLHDGVPDLLLHDRRGHDRPRRRARRAHAAWDSCFTVDYSHIHGGAVRGSTRSRYRQWMTHKLATWIDQFGSSGCVGCGRCITWCPVGIDITEEARAIRDERRRATMRTLEDLVAAAPLFAGLDRGARRADSRLRPQRALRPPAPTCSARASPPITST